MLMAQPGVEVMVEVDLPVVVHVCLCISMTGE